MSIKDTLKIIGAIAPSSPVLALAMVRFALDGPGKILEAGAGTGPITKILAKKVAGRVDVVEIMPEFAKLLQRRYGSSVAIHHCSILDFNTDIKYQYIVSSLPLNAFTPQMAQSAIDKLVSLAADGAILSFFEYRITQGLAPVVLTKKELADYRQTRLVIDEFVKRYQFDETTVYLNIPPAVVHYLRINKSGV